MDQGEKFRQKEVRGITKSIKCFQTLIEGIVTKREKKERKILSQNSKTKGQENKLIEKNLKRPSI